MLNKDDKATKAPKAPKTPAKPTTSTTAIPYAYEIGVKNRAVFTITADKVIVNNGILILVLGYRQVFVAAPQKWEFVQQLHPATPVIEAVGENNVALPLPS